MRTGSSGRILASLLAAAGLVVGEASAAPAQTQAEAQAETQAEAGPSIAVLGFELLKPDTMLAGATNTPEEQARIRMVAELMRERLSAHGYTVVDPKRTSDVVETAAAGQYLHACNGCELDAGKDLGADWVVVGWVQLVSNLILNLNVLVRDVDSGQIVAKAFVDLRSNTDKSWRRATHYMLDRILLDRLAAAR